MLYYSKAPVSRERRSIYFVRCWIWKKEEKLAGGDKSCYVGNSVEERNWALATCFVFFSFVYQRPEINKHITNMQQFITSDLIFFLVIWLIRINLRNIKSSLPSIAINLRLMFKVDLRLSDGTVRPGFHQPPLRQVLSMTFSITL